MSFSLTLPVRFADCDPAGIAYFPRLLALVDAAIEDWTEATLGHSRGTLHLDRRIGLPTVQLETGFLAPARLGDRLRLDVAVQNLGTTSLSLLVSGRVAARLCLEARLVQVLTDLGSMRPMPWPPAWRTMISTHLQKDCA